MGEYGLAEAALGARWKAGGMCGGVRDDQRGERWGMVHGARCMVHGACACTCACAHLPRHQHRMVRQRGGHLSHLQANGDKLDT